MTSINWPQDANYTAVESVLDLVQFFSDDLKGVALFIAELIQYTRDNYHMEKRLPKLKGSSYIGGILHSNSTF
jgi:hypothetical protein